MVMRNLLEFEKGYNRLQQRFAGQIDVVNSVDRSTAAAFDVNDREPKELHHGFVDISAKVRDISPLYGRVVLSMLRSDRNGVVYAPTVFTSKKDKDTGNEVVQMTRLEQPFATDVGITDGIRFGLGLKNATANESFGSHGGSGAYESGHFSTAIIGARDQASRSLIVAHGDKGAHQVGKIVGGVPEQMVESGLMDGIKPRTVTLDINNPNPIGIFWHKGLENENGMMAAEYDGAVKLMMGAATNALGDQALDSVGSLVDQTVRGA